MKALIATTLEDKDPFETLVGPSGPYKWLQVTDYMTIVGTSKDDYINGGDSNGLWVEGKAGNDSIIIGGNLCTIFGGAGHDYIVDTNMSGTSAAVINYLMGGAGNDYIMGRGFDAISGDAGNDTLGLREQVVATGGTGNDRFMLNHSTPGELDAIIADFHFSKRGEKDVIDFSQLGKITTTTHEDGTYTLSYVAPKAAEITFFADYTLNEDKLVYGGDQIEVWGLHQISTSVDALVKTGAVYLGEDWSVTVLGVHELIGTSDMAA